MTQDEIVKMAREAGLVRTGDKWVEPARWGATELVHFAALVAAHEREACARLCDQMFHDWCNQEFEDEDEAYRNKPDAEDCKKAIRARGEK
jgi:hypothetical protein